MLFIIHNVVLCIEGLFCAIAYNISHVCEAAPRPTMARGLVVKLRAAVPRSPRHPAGAPMYLRAAMCRNRSSVVVISTGNYDDFFGSHFVN